MSALLHPRYWGAHLLMLVALTATILLGLWQLSAWEAARTAEARDLTQRPAIALTDAMGGDDRFPGQYIGQPVSLRGQWLPDSTLFVSDRPHDGRRGYWVMTPVAVAGGGGSVVPVVRGWSPRPQADPVSGDVELTGWLQPSEGSNQPDPDPTDDVIPEMRIASVTQFVDADLYSAFVVASDASSGTTGLDGVRPEQIPEVSSLTSLRNLLYAIQWWVFGGFVVYVWQRWCRDTVERRAAEQQVASAA